MHILKLIAVLIPTVVVGIFLIRMANAALQHVAENTNLAIVAQASELLLYGAVIGVIDWLAVSLWSWMQ